jgi:Heterokaryon incompatibility protein (HET)
MSDSSIYSPLGRDSIRILTLQPGSGGDPIYCTLTPTAIKDVSASFVALSYVWGPESEKRSEIFVGDVPFLVRPNLYQALLTLRLSDQSQRFWIDAICINQEDQTEKNFQVPLMNQIYCLSSYVLVYLGESENDSDYVMDCIRRQDRDSFIQKRFLTGLAWILQRNWFKRTWILQEFVLNTASPQIVCGIGARVTWEEFEQSYPRDFPSTYLHEPEFAKLAMEAFADNAAFRFLRKFRRDFHIDSKSQLTHFDTRTFLWALNAGMRCDVSDPRDKVYGVLGLLDQQTKDGIDVDYNKTTGEVFRDAMVRMLEIEESPRIYGSFPIAPPALRKERSTPSWVLDFDPKLPDFTAFVEMFEFERPQPPPALRPIHLHGPQLSTQGLFLGQIDDILEAKYPFRTDTPIDLPIAGEYLQYRNLASFLLDLESLINSQFEKRKDFKLVEPLWKTLLVAESSGPQFVNSVDWHAKWETLMDFAKAYNAIPENDVIQLLQLMASPDRLTSLFHTLSPGQVMVFPLMATYRKTQPLSDSIRMVLCNSRCFFVCTNGQYGIGNPGFKKGDKLVLLFPDVYMPFVLRENGDHYEMVGLAYIPPPMKQKAIETGVDDLREFIIV